MNQNYKYGLFFLSGLAVGALGAMAISRGKLSWLSGMLPLHLTLLALFIGLMAWRSGALQRKGAR
jgi:hypothetical protein